MMSIATVFVKEDEFRKKLAEIATQKKRVFLDAGELRPMTINVVEDQTEGGRPSVVLILDLDNGDCVVMETTARLFCATARTIEARYPSLFVDH